MDSIFMQNIQNFLGGSRTSYSFPGLVQYGHRQYNHDILSALLTGYMQAGSNGMQAAMAHLFEDAISDQLVRMGGAEFRDLIEAMFNCSYSTGKRYGHRKFFHKH